LRNVNGSADAFKTGVTGVAGVAGVAGVQEFRSSGVQEWRNLGGIKL
jgi:hypothetical protein